MRLVVYSFFLLLFVIFILELKQILVWKSRRFHICLLLLYIYNVLILVSIFVYRKVMNRKFPMVSFSDHFMFLFIMKFWFDCVISSLYIQMSYVWKKTSTTPRRREHSHHISQAKWFSVLIGEENDKDSSLTHLNKWHHWSR